jgi:hypothetical protein
LIFGDKYYPDFCKGGAKEVAGKRSHAVILRAVKDLALCIFKAMRDSSSPAAQNDSAYEFFRSLLSPDLPAVPPMRSILVRNPG